MSSKLRPNASGGSVVLVTGGNSGIGFNFVAKLLESDFRVIVIDKSTDKLKSLVDTSKSRLIVGEIDLLDSIGLERFIKSSISKLGQISGVAHIAGVPCPMPLKALTRSKVQEVFFVNTLSAFDLVKICVKKGIGTDTGMSFVFISSIYSLVGSSSSSGYAASKAALNGLMRALSIEYAPRNIRLNCIAPGFIMTEMFDDIVKKFGEGYIERIRELHPLGLGSPEDVSNTILFLLSPQARWITGAVIPVDGGYTAQ